MRVFYSFIFSPFFLFFFLFTKIAWVRSIAVPFRGCSLVRWRASNDELRSLPTQCSDSLTLSPSCHARSLPRSRRFSLFVAPFVPFPSLSLSLSLFARAHGFAQRRSHIISSLFIGWTARERERENPARDSRLAAMPSGETERDIMCDARKRQEIRIYLPGCYLRGGKSTPRERRLPR